MHKIAVPSISQSSESGEICPGGTTMKARPLARPDIMIGQLRHVGGGKNL